MTERQFGRRLERAARLSEKAKKKVYEIYNDSNVQQTDFSDLSKALDCLETAHVILRKQSDIWQDSHV